MNTHIHSVTLVGGLCKGCTNCIKRCPTEAIRVRRGKATIISKRCIDCGECIRICPYYAKKAVYDGLSVLDRYKHTVAILPMELFAQFADIKSESVLFGGIKQLGFDEVFDISKAQRIIDETLYCCAVSDTVKKPVISSRCPSITRLIQIRFPDLLENILPLITPGELAARMAKKTAAEKTGLREEDIGCIYISPCPAMVTEYANPVGIAESAIDAAVSVQTLYPLLRVAMKNTQAESSDGLKNRILDMSIALKDRYLEADGIENCIRVLEGLEDEKFDVDLVSLYACPAGCAGGVLNVENPFIAKVRLHHMMYAKEMHCDCGKLDGELLWEHAVNYKPVLALDEDIALAIEKMNEVDKIVSNLRGLDCGSCGSPSCRAFAEDVINGYTTLDKCIFVLRESMHDLAQKLDILSEWNRPV